MQTNDPSFLSINSFLQEDLKLILNENKNVLKIVAGNLSQSAHAAVDFTPASLQTITPSAPAAPRKRLPLLPSTCKLPRSQREIDTNLLD
jgi:hypothetical protein